jgi:hypothetical protein
MEEHNFRKSQGFGLTAHFCIKIIINDIKDLLKDARRD